MTAGVLLLALLLPDAVRLLARLEARRPARRRPAPRASRSPAALVAFVALIAGCSGGPVLAPIAAGLAIFVMLGSLDRNRRARLAARRLARRRARRARAACRCRSGAARSPISASGSTLLGLAATGFGAETIATMRVGVAADGRPLSRSSLDSVGERAGPNYRETVAAMTIRSGGARRRDDRAGAPAIRRAPDGDDAGRHRHARFRPDLRLDRRSRRRRRACPARLYWKPLVTLIWLGACVMALGGAFSLADRRLRFGAPARAEAGAAAAPAAAR